ncbi:MAG: MFS transporter [Rhodobacterales bacterium]|nr:MAG: MFS transporter [Rhodobacterales bacterium]
MSGTAARARLGLALGSGLFDLPEAGDIAVFGADAERDLGALPRDRVHVICRRKPDFDLLERAGFRVALTPPDRAALAIVFVTRAKAETRDMLAQAARIAPMLVIDGQKTDGIDSVFKEMRKRTECSSAFSKAHGKLFVATNPNAALSDWSSPPTPNRDGFTTAPGVFSADGVDPASRLLAQALPDRLGAHLVDLGAGWGYLSHAALTRADVARIDLVEADHAALDCARINVDDPRAAFHWADATLWRPNAGVDGVIMNPPFHQGRKGVPALGQAFIRNAAAMLSPAGRLWLVANRHLPYEDELAQRFGKVEEIAGDNRFKVLAATRPARKPR